MASRYEILSPSGEILGIVERKQADESNLHQRLLTADSRLLGVLRRVDTGGSSSREYRYDEPADGSLQGLELRQTAASLKQAGTWSVNGLRTVSEESRLLVVAHQLIIEPWAAGENAADKTRHDQSGGRH